MGENDVIVWVNGAFGSGKSTLVEELRGRWPGALVFDPEVIGYVLREIVEVPTGDFQDLRLWRRQVAGFLVGLVEEYGQECGPRPVLVPMTLVKPDYVAEVFGAIEAAGVPLHHFFLQVPEDVLRARIDGRSFTPDDPKQDARVRRWCKDRIPECVAAAGVLPSGTVFLDGEASPGELAELVFKRVGA